MRLQARRLKAEGHKGHRLVDAGNGAPVLLIPGIQGRWEWMRPAVDALARHSRVITFSLGGGTSAEATIREVDAALDAARLESAVICGVSMGGVVALRYALRRPHRTTGLVLVSTPGPRWQANTRQAFFARHWAAAAPLFALNALVALVPEVVRGRGGILAGLAFAVRHGTRVLAHPVWPKRMKERYDVWLDAARDEDYTRVSVPTLVVTGEPELDRVVPVGGTLEYCDRITSARSATIARTGHLGLITRSDRFAEIVTAFADDCAAQRPARDR